MSSDDDDYYIDDPFDKPASQARGSGSKKQKAAPTDLRARGGKNQQHHQSPAPASNKPATSSNHNNNPSTANSLASAIDAMQPDKEHYLTPADKILNRLKWDDTLDVREFEIGYEDRFKGLMFMPAARFRGGEGESTDGDAIPWHRVRQYVYKGRIVWDQKARINLVDDLAEEVRRIREEETGRAQAMAATGMTSLKHMTGERLKIALPKLAKQQEEAKNSNSNKSKNSGNSKDSSAGQLSDKDTLKVVTYNILHDIFDANEIYTDLRIPLIVKEIEAHKPDVIFLQEATLPRFKELVESSPNLRNNFYWTMLPSQVSSSQVIGSRFPLIEGFAEQISRNKRRIFALMENPWAQERGSKEAKSLPILLVNVHFLSDHGAGDAIGKRLNEVKTLNENIAGFPRVIIAGDFNFGDQNSESSVEFKGMKDVWLEEYKRQNNLSEITWPDDVVKSGGMPKKLSAIGGFTFDITRNPLANLSCEHHRYPRRLDRILYRAFNPVPDSVKIFGIEPYSLSAVPKEIVNSCSTPVPTDDKVYPSDHFGIAVTFKKDDAVYSGAGAAAVGHRATAAVGSSNSNNNNGNDDDDDDNTTNAKTPSQSALATSAFDTSNIDPVVLSMSKAGAFGKHYRTALVFLPPPALYEKINRFRSNGRDKAYPRWPCHTTILFPFVAPGKFGDAIELIEAAMQAKFINVEPFRVKLRKVGVFSRGPKAVVFLEPECVSRTDSKKSLGIAPMKAIFDPLQYLFPQCGRGGGGAGASANNDDDKNNTNNNEQDDHGPAGYSPHFTLGQTVNPKDHQQFLARINAEWEPVEFDVSQFHLIAHLDGKEGFEVIHTFDLDTGASASRKDHNEGLVSLSNNNSSTGVTPSTSPSSNNNQNSFAAAVASAEGKMMATILEPPQWGSRLLKPYVPPDPLEQWMATVTIPKYARDAPTHISQLGGMYHIPGNLLDDYLRKWLESYKLRNSVASYMEEIRGNPFRLYVDLDFDLATDVQVQKSYALDLIREISIFTNRIFPNSDPTVAVFECHGSASKKFADGSVPDSDDEKAQNNNNSDDVRVSKSGYRIYFQRIFTDDATYDKYLTAVTNYLRRKHWAYPDNIVRGVTWEEIIDKKAVTWNRGRLLGTIKRRKNLKRIYEFLAVVTVRGTHELLSKEFDSSILRQLYASTLRLWETIPKLDADGKSILMDNEFTVQRICTWDTETEGRAATAHESK